LASSNCSDKDLWLFLYLFQIASIPNARAAIASAITAIMNPTPVLAKPVLTPSPKPFPAAIPVATDYTTI
jgi:hypothetical protein